MSMTARPMKNPASVVDAALIAIIVWRLRVQPGCVVRPRMRHPLLRRVGPALGRDVDAPERYQQRRRRCWQPAREGSWSPPDKRRTPTYSFPLRFSCQAFEALFLGVQREPREIGSERFSPHAKN